VAVVRIWVNDLDIPNDCPVNVGANNVVIERDPDRRFVDVSDFDVYAGGGSSRIGPFATRLFATARSPT
jgi:hypothetical protein